MEKIGRLDVLVFVQNDRFAITLFLLQVNNAGVLEMGTIKTTSLEQYDRLTCCTRLLLEDVTESIFC